MEKSITIKRERKGIEITVVTRENSYDLFVDVTPEADLSKKIVEKDYVMKLILHNKSKSARKPLHLEFLNQKYKDSQANSNSVIKIKNDMYRFQISLKPTLYFFPSKLAEARIKLIESKKKKKSKKKKIEDIPIEGIKLPGLSTSNFTNYTNSNIGRPYSGGRCSPK